MEQRNGPVGRLSTEGLSDVFEIYAQELGSKPLNAMHIKKSFLKHKIVATCHLNSILDHKVCNS
jgi:hypothetical protein